MARAVDDGPIASAFAHFVANGAAEGRVAGDPVALGTGAGQVDRIEVGGMAALDGAVELIFLDGFALQVGDDSLVVSILEADLLA